LCESEQLAAGRINKFLGGRAAEANTLIGRFCLSLARSLTPANPIRVRDSAADQADVRPTLAATRTLVSLERRSDGAPSLSACVFPSGRPSSAEFIHPTSILTWDGQHNRAAPRRAFRPADLYYGESGAVARSALGRTRQAARRGSQWQAIGERRRRRRRPGRSGLAAQPAGRADCKVSFVISFSARSRLGERLDCSRPGLAPSKTARKFLVVVVVVAAAAAAATAAAC
jgi:hypothetical protein